VQDEEVPNRAKISPHDIAPLDSDALARPTRFNSLRPFMGWRYGLCGRRGRTSWGFQIQEWQQRAAVLSLGSASAAQ